MTARSRSEITCDADGCLARFVGDTHRAQDARAGAAAAGWVHRVVPPAPPRQFARGVDLCPDHPDAFPSSVAASVVL